VSRRPARRLVAAALLTGLAAGGLAGVSTVAAPTRAAAAEEGCGGEAPVLLDEQPPVLAQLGATRAWRTATGRGVVVAVVDSGVDTANEHLADAVEPGTDLVGASDDPTGRTDSYGHGTGVAGIIAARRVAGSGVVGLARDATILPVRVFHDESAQAQRDGTGPTAGRIAAGIRWAAEHGAQVVNVSMSTDDDSAELRSAVRSATQAGALVVASAGNRNTATNKDDRARFPAAYPEVLAVAAVDADLHPTDASIHGDHVDVAAPGQQVLTVYPGGGDCWYALDTPAPSWSTAYVSAAAALVAQRFPDETPAQWAYRLEVTAARSTPGVRTDETGWGVVRPELALTFVDDGTAAGPPSPARTPAPAATPPGPVSVAQPVDPLAPVRASAVWWALGVTVAVLLSALAWRLVGPRRTR